MTILRRTLTTAILGLCVSGAALPTPAQPQGPVTYVALLWIKPGGADKLAEYEKGFGGILRAWNAQARPVTQVAPRSFNTQDPRPFKYRLPDRIDVVTFPNAATWPQIMKSEEWRAIKPLRDAALEDLVIFETTSLLDQ